MLPELMLVKGGGKEPGQMGRRAFFLKPMWKRSKKRVHQLWPLPPFLRITTANRLQLPSILSAHPILLRIGTAIPGLELQAGWHLLNSKLMTGVLVLMMTGTQILTMKVPARLEEVEALHNFQRLLTVATS
jgi:hypothetical protein